MNTWSRRPSRAVNLAVTFCARCYAAMVDSARPVNPTTWKPSPCFLHIIFHLGHFTIFSGPTLEILWFSFQWLLFCAKGQGLAWDGDAWNIALDFSTCRFDAAFISIVTLFCSDRVILYRFLSTRHAFFVACVCVSYCRAYNWTHGHAVLVRPYDAVFMSFESMTSEHGDVSVPDDVFGWFTRQLAENIRTVTSPRELEHDWLDSTDG